MKQTALKTFKNIGLQDLSEDQAEHLLSHMKEIHYQAGDIIVAQDDDDDHSYVIKNGQASVNRKPDSDSKEITLANLHQGDGFGEEALFSQHPRTATVTMAKEGELMRLSKKDFSELLAKPMLKMINWQQAQKKMAEGAVLIDIRDATDYKSNHLADAINIPLPMLRLKIKQLAPDKTYITYCNDGSRSAAASFILNQEGLKTDILDGGMNLQNNPTELNIEEEFAKMLQSSLPINDNKILMSDTSKEHSSKNQAKQKAGVADHYQNMGSADYWGAPVEDASSDLFNDSSEFNDTPKTAAFIEETPAAFHPKKEPVGQNYKTIKQVPPALKTPYLETGNRLRNVSIFIIIIASLGYGASTIFSPASQEVKPITIDAVPAIEISNPQNIGNVEPVIAVPSPPLTSTPQTLPLNSSIADSVEVKTEAFVKPVEAEEPSTSAAIIYEEAQPIKKPSLDPATRGFRE